MKNSLMDRLRFWKYCMSRLVATYASPPASYSQHGEDLAVKEILGTVRSFIDVGANDGLTFSNTYLFARARARGLCFEPVPQTFALARFYHFLHRGVKCVRAGVSDSRQTMKMSIAGYGGLLSSVDDSQANDDAVEVDVFVDRLDAWVAKYPAFAHVDLLSVDVEGHELRVVQGIDFTKFSARCVIVETDKTPAATIDTVLGPHGYRLMLTNGLNSFWFGGSEAVNEGIERVCSGLHGYTQIS